MAELYTILPEVIETYAKAVYDVTPKGAGTYTWRRFDGDRMTEKADRVRLFDIYASTESDLTPVFAFGDGANDIDVLINIDICYQDLEAHNIIGLGDYEAIRRKLLLLNTSSIEGYNFCNIDTPIWLEADDDTKYKYMRIPVTVRLSVSV
jgi:hypothetical protein